MGDLFVLIQKIDITNKLEDYLGDIRQDIPQIDKFVACITINISYGDGLMLLPRQS